MILGTGGQLGSELHKLYPGAICYDHNIGATSFLDFQDYEKLEAVISSHKCRWIINAAALTNVDACETKKAIAYSVNGIAVRSIVMAARKIGANLLHVSTDYIFDGKKGMYDEFDVPNPQNFYGISKLVGETYALGYDGSLVVRTSGVYGSKNNFPIFVYRQLVENRQTNVLEGYYSPIHAKNLAIAIKKLIENNERGIFNVAGIRTSRIDLAFEIAKKYSLNKKLINKVEKIDSMMAVRPYDSSLDISKTKKILDFDFYSYDSNLKCFDDSIIHSQKR
ncbi:MAG: NAD(P)-dependent oxidoreductase [Thermoplasmatales archaeon]|jgi:dTDP-4-dehydrorhamnose reductase|nr:NAD(P)-dependent oxidoreductase [Thermoplasmatales archaeon]